MGCLFDQITVSLAVQKPLSFRSLQLLIVDLRVCVNSVLSVQEVFSVSWVQGLLHFLFFEIQGIQLNDNLSLFEVEFCSGCYVWVCLHSLACSHSVPPLRCSFFFFLISFPVCVSGFFIKDQISVGFFICILAFSLIHWSMCMFCANANLKSGMVLDLFLFYQMKSYFHFT